MTAGSGEDGNDSRVLRETAITAGCSANGNYSRVSRARQSPAYFPGRWGGGLAFRHPPAQARAGLKAPRNARTFRRQHRYGTPESQATPALTPARGCATPCRPGEPTPPLRPGTNDRAHTGHPRERPPATRRATTGHPASDHRPPGERPPATRRAHTGHPRRATTGHPASDHRPPGERPPATRRAHTGHPRRATTGPPGKPTTNDVVPTRPSTQPQR
jgi:hypothetical protein